MTEFALHHTEVKTAGWCSGKTHWYQCRQWQIQGMWKMHSPPRAIFKHVFDEYNSFIILNLFDNNKPYALSTHNRKCTNKMQYLVKYSDFGAKYSHKICLKIIQKVLKWTLQYANFKKFSGEACPRTPLKPLLFSICFKMILPENIRLKIQYVKIWCPP